jgi:hypothetical protein
MLRSVTRFPCADVTAVLISGYPEWQEISSIEETLVRVSDVDGRAGIAGFHIEFLDGSTIGISNNSIMGVRT